MCIAWECLDTCMGGEGWGAAPCCCVRARRLGCGGRGCQNLSYTLFCAHAVLPELAGAAFCAPDSISYTGPLVCTCCGWGGFRTMHMQQIALHGLPGKSVGLLSIPTEPPGPPFPQCEHSTELTKPRLEARMVVGGLSAARASAAAGCVPAAMPSNGMLQFRANCFLSCILHAYLYCSHTGLNHIAAADSHQEQSPHWKEVAPSQRAMHQLLTSSECWGPSHLFHRQT